MPYERGEATGRLGRVDFLRALVVDDRAELVERVQVALDQRDVDGLPFLGIQFRDVLVQLDGGDRFGQVAGRVWALHIVHDGDDVPTSAGLDGFDCLFYVEGNRIITAPRGRDDCCHSWQRWFRRHCAGAAFRPVSRCSRI